MKRTITILSVAAVLQLILVTVTWMGNTGLTEHITRTTLLTFDKAEIDRLLITDGTGTIELVKKDGTWRTGDNYPADRIKITGLLDKLADLKTGMPVATSTSALSRFKVAQDNFERRLELFSGTTRTAALYLGTGAGARRSHARAAEQKEVYTVTLGSYDTPVTPESWYDKTVLELDPDKITSVHLDDLKLERTVSDKEPPGEWTVTGGRDKSEPAQEAINQALGKLASLRYDTILGREQKDEYGLNQPVLQVSLTWNDTTRAYRFGKMKDGDEYVLKVSDRDEFFRLPSYTVTPLLEAITADKWLVGREQAEEEGKSAAEQAKTETPAKPQGASSAR